MIGCICLQGMQRSAPSSRNVTWYLEKSTSSRFVTRTSPLTAKIGGSDWTDGAGAGAGGRGGGSGAIGAGFVRASDRQDHGKDRGREGQIIPTHE